MSLEDQIREVFQKNNVFLGNDDPILVFTRTFSEKQIQTFSEMEQVSKDGIKKCTEKVREDLENITRKVREDFSREFAKEAESLAMSIIDKEKKTIEMLHSFVAEDIEKLKRAHNIYWMISLAIFIATLAMNFWIPKAAAATSVGLQANAFNDKGSVGVAGDVGVNKLIGIRGNLNKGLESEDYGFGGLQIRLFPQSIFHFSIGYDTASFDANKAEALGASLGLMSPIIVFRAGYEERSIETNFATENVGIPSLSIKTMLTPAFGVESTLEYASSNFDDRAHSISLGTTYQWSQTIYTAHALGYTCDERCSNPLTTTLGIRFTPKKGLSFTLSARTFPNTILAPIQTQVLADSRRQITSYQLRASLNI